MHYLMQMILAKNPRNIILRVLEVYDEIAIGFSRFRTRPWRISDIAKHGLIIDLGSGPCINGIYVSKMREGYLICLDISFSMSMISRDNIIKNRVLGDSIAADMLFLPIRDDVADTILAIASLHHIPKKYLSIVLNEIKRISKPLGIIVITIWSWRQIRFLLYTLFNVVLFLIRAISNIHEYFVPWRKRDRIYWRYYYLPSIEWLEKLSREIGLRVLSRGFIGYLKNRSENIYIVATKQLQS
ncbi:Methyltransferase type 11 [Ignisphaera aggregans DSM 17230]|uniref:Methyltransferase type 11 n=1 Tax=Ignisphaera aggregans (strain DSM 17230 / JCM 13409 / AQ1.S1) TaxID=583356 RepID=E0SSN0_IGNAA|nr:Methyltransferase type 11 [Ignisphaera aggregans DSM 17230]